MTNWKAFLCDSKNKEELFDFLSDEVSKTEWPESKGVYITRGTSKEIVNQCWNAHMKKPTQGLLFT